jgi:protein gp37
MGSTSIEWTEDTWNPLAGCTPISPGCTNCYAARMARRLEAMGQEKYRGTAERRGAVDVFTGRINFDEDSLSQPLHWKKPRRVFVNSMSDLFHEDVPFEFIDRVFAVMALCPQHTFQVLTKRAERMAEYFGIGGRQIGHREGLIREQCEEAFYRGGLKWGTVLKARAWPWPFQNICLGVSVEDQKRTTRFKPLCELGEVGWRTMVSLEPLLAHVTIPRRYLALGDRAWVIVGGESGPGARPFDVTWARSLLSQCRSVGIPVFVKQLGALIHVANDRRMAERRRRPADRAVREPANISGRNCLVQNSQSQRRQPVRVAGRSPREGVPMSHVTVIADAHQRPTDDPRALADRIAAALFRTHSGQQCQRLMLVDDEPKFRDHGGWCQSAVADVIEGHLRGLRQ